MGYKNTRSASRLAILRLVLARAPVLPVHARRDGASARRRLELSDSHAAQAYGTCLGHVSDTSRTRPGRVARGANAEVGADGIDRALSRLGRRLRGDYPRLPEISREYPRVPESTRD